MLLAIFGIWLFKEKMEWVHDVGVVIMFGCCVLIGSSGEGNQGASLVLFGAEVEKVSVFFAVMITLLCPIIFTVT